jgi:hypothetical protein
MKNKTNLYQFVILTSLVISVISCNKENYQSQSITTLYHEKKLLTITRSYSAEKTLLIKDTLQQFIVAKAWFFTIEKKTNRANESKKILQKIKESNPYYLEPQIYLARIEYFYFDNKKGAVEILQNVLRLENDNLKALTLLFKIYLKSDNKLLTEKIAKFIVMYKNQVAEAWLFLNKDQNKK